MRNFAGMVLFAAACTYPLLPLQAQNEYGFVYQRYNYAVYVPVDYTPAVAVRSITFTAVKRSKKQKANVYYKEYNSRMQLTAMLRKTKDTMQPVATYKYNEQGKCIYDVKYKRGKPSSVVFYRYNTMGKPLITEYRSGNNRVISRAVWKYNNDSCVSELLYYANETRLKKRWVYTYYDSAQLEKTVLYNRKGTLKQQWLFTCKTEGEELTPARDTRQICTWNQQTATTISKTFQTFDEKGRIIKSVFIYRSSDTALMEWQYHKNGRLSKRTIYDFDINYPLKTTWYKKGKAYYEYNCTYNNGLITSKEGVKQGRCQYKMVYVYNENKLLAEYIEYTKKNKEYLRVTLSYP